MKYFFISLFLHITILFGGYFLFKDKIMTSPPANTGIEVNIGNISVSTSSQGGGQVKEEVKKEPVKKKEKTTTKKEVKKKEQKIVENSKNKVKKIEKKEEKVIEPKPKEVEKKEEIVEEVEEKDEKVTKTDPDKEVSKTDKEDTVEGAPGNSSGDKKDISTKKGGSAAGKLGSDVKTLGDGSLVAVNQGVKGLEYKFLSTPAPTFPIRAKKLGIKGPVVVKARFLIGYNGRVEEVKFYDKNSAHGFHEEVRSVLLNKWKTTPIMLKGEKVKLYFYKEFKFQII